MPTKRITTLTYMSDVASRRRPSRHRMPQFRRFGSACTYIIGVCSSGFWASPAMMHYSASIAGYYVTTLKSCLDPKIESLSCQSQPHLRAPRIARGALPRPPPPPPRPLPARPRRSSATRDCPFPPPGVRRVSAAPRARRSRLRRAAGTAPSANTWRGTFPQWRRPRGRAGSRPTPAAEGDVPSAETQAWQPRAQQSARGRAANEWRPPKPPPPRPRPKRSARAREPCAAAAQWHGACAGAMGGAIGARLAGRVGMICTQYSDRSLWGGVTSTKYEVLRESGSLLQVRFLVNAATLGLKQFSQLLPRS